MIVIKINYEGLNNQVFSLNIFENIFDLYFEFKKNNIF